MFKHSKLANILVKNKYILYKKNYHPTVWCSTWWGWWELLLNAYVDHWLLDGGLGESLLEHSRLLGFSPCCSLGEVICFLVFSSRDMLELHAPEVLLDLVYLFKVGYHVGVLRRVAFVGEVDEELRITLDEGILIVNGSLDTSLIC